MSAYVIADVEITDANLYDSFSSRSATFENHGGRFVVRGAGIDIIEGDWTPKRIAILVFDSTERAKEWLGSPEYAALDDIRTRSSNINMVVVEGL